MLKSNSIIHKKKKIQVFFHIIYKLFTIFVESIKISNQILVKITDTDEKNRKLSETVSGFESLLYLFFNNYQHH